MGKASRRKRQRQQALSSDPPPTAKVDSDSSSAKMSLDEDDAVKSEPRKSENKNNNTKNGTASRPETKKAKVDAASATGMPRTDDRYEGKTKGKEKKNKRSSSGVDANATTRDRDDAAETTTKKTKTTSESSNPLASKLQAFLDSIPAQERNHFFSNTHVDPERRAELWARQADVGEELVNQYAWAIPDKRALQVLQHFAPLVEIGCGANAYWCKLMKGAGIDIVAYDDDPESGGKIAKSHLKGQQLRTKKGGPEVLGHPSNEGRNLFLCYPDENESMGEDGEQFSLGLACLGEFKGDYVIHVGEVYGDTLSVDQAPWGRSSSPGFQERLATEFHCVMRIQLPNWIHVRDTLTVWKRSSLCAIVFGDEDDEGSVEEVAYRYIPPEERLPVEQAAPFLAHFLQRDEPNGRMNVSLTKTTLTKDERTDTVSPPRKGVEKAATSSTSTGKAVNKNQKTSIDKTKEKLGYECAW